MKRWTISKCPLSLYIPHAFEKSTMKEKRPTRSELYRITLLYRHQLHGSAQSLLLVFIDIVLWIVVEARINQQAKMLRGINLISDVLNK